MLELGPRAAAGSSQRSSAARCATAGVVEEKMLCRAKADMVDWVAHGRLMLPSYVPLISGGPHDGGHKHCRVLAAWCTCSI